MQDRLSHFKCYPIVNRSNPPHSVAMVDQFFRETAAVGEARLVCNPVRKRITSGQRPIDVTGTHLVCYFINGRNPPPRVVYLNQLEARGETELQEARLLCVPSEKEFSLNPPV